MDSQGERIVSGLLGELEEAWNAADGTRFARPFAEDADFVNVRGEHVRTREVIARGHQAIFDTIYKGSVVRYVFADARAIGPAILLAHAKATLNAPVGPLAGEHRSTFSMVLVQDQDEWRVASFHNTLVATGAIDLRSIAEPVQLS